MAEERDDYDLVRRYLENGDQASFRILLNRYLDITKRVVSRYCENKSDVDDLVQQIWIKIIDSLSRYENQNRFIAFHNTIAKNTIKDYWKFKNVRSSTISFEDISNGTDSYNPASTELSEERKYSSHQAVNHLATQLIPSLPCNLKTVFILRHEAEFWERNRRLSWSALGKLFGLSETEVWQHFDRVRKASIEALGGSKQKPADNLSEEELSVFIIWTQAQRLPQLKKVTEADLADLLGIPVNTFKTNYRKAKSILTESMEQWEPGSTG